MKTLPRFVTACVVALTLISPVSPVQSAENPRKTVEEKPWVWPLPPEKPRVSHLKTVMTPQDLGVTKGFFAKLWEYIAGEDTADRILSPHGIVADGEGKVY